MHSGRETKQELKAEARLRNFLHDILRELDFIHQAMKMQGRAFTGEWHI